LHALLIDGFARQGRHPDVRIGADPYMGHGAPDVMRGDDSGFVDGLINQHGAIDQELLVQRRLEAGVETRYCSARAVTLRAIGIEIGAGAILDAARGIISRGQGGNFSQVFVVQRLLEQADVIPGAQLIVDHARGVFEISIQLPRLDAEHQARIGGVTGEAVLRARVVPSLPLHAAIGRRDGNFFCFRCGQQIGVAAVGPPLVGDSIDAALAVAHQQAGLEPPLGIGVARVDG
jgi:hypothetical protein